MENNTVTIPEREYESLIRDSEKVRILTQAVLDDVDPGYWLQVILGVQRPVSEIMETEKEKQSETVSPPPMATKTPRGRSKKKLDRGKILALHNAGWTQKAIAEELRCSEGSVSMILKEEKEKYHE